MDFMFAYQLMVRQFDIAATIVNVGKRHHKKLSKRGEIEAIPRASNLLRFSMAGSHFPPPPPISNTNQSESASKSAIGNDLNLGLEDFPLLPVPSSSFGVNGASKPNPNSCWNGNGHNI
ncbi:hypothetical protein C5167_015624 [Papaver somniferum]|uniref:Uncharacterized protein n=1 Tax=Papaver somniferum TaxID=3469 RepID=A0A4Y7J9P0_PAPSO|nr:hypothetical protein C5167_015624 [Papaver somniferum]